MRDATPLRPVPASSRAATPVRTRVVQSVPAVSEPRLTPTAHGVEHVDPVSGEIINDSPASVPVAQPLPAPPTPQYHPEMVAGLGTRTQIQDELDQMAVQIRAFHLKQPDQVLRECSAYTARLTELCVLLHRVESTDRQYTRVRTQQVERWLAELDRQFKMASRLIEVMRQDLQLSGVGT